MKCENCGHLASDGYEYPEYYCEIGIGPDHKRATEDGCNLKKAERRRICKTLASQDVPLWWDESCAEGGTGK